MEIIVLDDSELFRKAAELFYESAKASILGKVWFSVALSGGSTPKRLYSILAEDYTTKVEWGKVQIFFSDERCVPKDHPDSNYRMVNDALLSLIDIPTANVHRMQGELNPTEAALEYETEIANVFSSGIPKFDLILLGIGENCHIASIFPHSEVISEKSKLAAAPYVQELNTHRITLTQPVIENAEEIMVLATGDNKADAIHNAIDLQLPPEECPAQLLKSSKGKVTWLIDGAAASKLQK